MLFKISTKVCLVFQNRMEKIKTSEHTATCPGCVVFPLAEAGGNMFVKLIAYLTAVVQLILETLRLL